MLDETVKYTRLQLSALELSILAGAIALFVTYFSILWITAYCDRCTAFAKAEDRQAGRAAGYSRMSFDSDAYWAYSKDWQHGYAEGKSARIAGKPLEYLAEAIPLIVIIGGPHEDQPM